MKNKHNPKESFLETYNYDNWFENEESTDTTRENDKKESDISALESNKEGIKVEKGLKIVTSNQLIARLPILLAQIKAGNNSIK